MLLAKNLPSYFIPSDVIAVDTPVIMRQTMKISIALIWKKLSLSNGPLSFIDAQTWLLWLAGPRTLAVTSERQHSAMNSG